jgi:hypothetical protein
MLAAVAAGGRPAATIAPISGSVRASVEETFVDGAPKVRLVVTAPPSVPCGQLVAAVERSGAETRVRIDGVSPPDGGRCLFMEPPPPSATFDLTADTGRRRLILKHGTRADAFALEITDQRIAVEPAGATSMTQLETPGPMLRVPTRAIWVEITYDDDAARTRSRRQAANLVAALEAAGARRFTPIAGKYASRANAWQVLDPHAPRSLSWPPPSVEYDYFTYAGGFDALAAIGGRFKKVRGMTVHISGWQGRVFNTR